MRIGTNILTKYNGKVKKFKVYKTNKEDVYLTDGEIKITRKYWEIRKVPKNWEE